MKNLWDFPRVTHIGICLPMQGTQVQCLVWEESKRHGTAKPTPLEPGPCSRRSRHSEKPERAPQLQMESSPRSLKLEKARTAAKAWQNKIEHKSFSALLNRHVLSHKQYGS